MRKEKEKKKKSWFQGIKSGGSDPGTMRKFSHRGQHGASSSTVASSRLAQRDRRRGKVGIRSRIVCSLQHV